MDVGRRDARSQAVAYHSRPVQRPDFVHTETVRFRDLDPMGHVNNAVYLTYIESARTAFLLSRRAISGLDDLAIVVARAEIDFRSPLRFGEDVEIAVRPVRFGAKSFDLQYELRAGGRLVAQANTVCVGFDYSRREPMAIPNEWRERLAA